MRRPSRLLIAALFLLWLAVAAVGAAGTQGKGKEPLDENGQPRQPLSDVAALVEAAIRLPSAAVLGAALAFRPRRRGTPPRHPAVIQTQILLAVVGALVMMVVGSSLARAFGIVGAAGLIRYRAKIEDPKDAGVMLASLGVGLAAGVGLYMLSIFGTLFFLLLLGIVESIAEGYQVFDLTIESEHVGEMRERLERLLDRQGIKYELRSFSGTQLCYVVRLPLKSRTDRVASAIHRLSPEPAPSVSWEERKVK